MKRTFGPQCSRSLGPGTSHRVAFFLELRAGLRARLAGPEKEEGQPPLRTASVRAAPAARQEDAEHRGPPDNYLVTHAVSPSEAPDDVRAMAEGTLSHRGFTFDDVVFVAEVRDADVTEPPAYPEWLVAVHGPSRNPE